MFFKRFFIYIYIINYQYSWFFFFKSLVLNENELQTQIFKIVTIAELLYKELLLHPDKYLVNSKVQNVLITTTVPASIYI